MVLDLVHMILGELPQDLRFLYAFGVIFVLYVFLKMLTMFINIIIDFVGDI